MRESGAAPLMTGDVACLPVLHGEGELTAEVAYGSATGHHLFALPARLAVAGAAPAPIDLPLLAALLVDALSDDDRREPQPGAARLAVLERIAASTAAVTEFLAARAGDLGAATTDAPADFIDTEQALVLGHQLHPTPKSRSELGPAERRRYSPELRGRFPLAWLAVDRRLLQQGSAVRVPGASGVAADAGAGRAIATTPAIPAEQLALTLLDERDADALREAAGDAAAVPVHPWQLAQLRHDPRVAELLRRGLLRELGEHGDPVTPTSSLRTLYHERSAWQLKCSLSVRVTNSMRVTLPRELDRAVEAATLAQTTVGAAMRDAAPHWVVVHDPAYLAVRDADGVLIDELSVLLRENRWPAGCGLDATAITSLCQPAPLGGAPRLARIVERLAATSGAPPDVVARAWFGRYLDVFARSVLRLYLDLGLTFEPHQQNVLLELEGGWPARAVHRDSQGYFHREAAHDDLCQVIPTLGEATESIFPEALADERLIYYPFLNNALGVIGALGSSGLSNERTLLGDLHAVIADERERGGRYPATLLDRLLDAPSWPCKANLRTRIRDLDELVGDIAEQSVYVSIPNPLRLPGVQEASR